MSFHNGLPKNSMNNNNLNDDGYSIFRDAFMECLHKDWKKGKISTRKVRAILGITALNSVYYRHEVKSRTNKKI